MIKRTLQYTISEKLKDRKVIIILGPRQVGKSTLLKLMQKEVKVMKQNIALKENNR